jgi:AAA15 family ATPase/GTPase
MFKQVTLKNFRTHKSTTIELYPVTLLIGNNNSGKTNLLAGIQHFCRLVRRGKPGNRYRTVNAAQHLYPHRYRLAKDEDPIAFSILWNNPDGEISYEIEVYKSEQFRANAGCKEKISINLASASSPKEVNSGYDKPTDLLALREKIESEPSLKEIEKQLCNLFFADFASTFSYHFQPSFLKGMVKDGNKDTDENQDIDEIENNPNKEIRIPADLGETGRNFQAILRHIKENEQRTFSLFLAKMRTLDNSFQGVRYDPKRSSLIWEFDLGRKGSVEEFMPDVVSDGFMKIAVISLLASLRRPPALIMLEEIENGINPGNIQQLMNWIWQATSPSQEGFSSQFIITSHSPSVLREFNEHPDHVYTVRLDKRSRQSDVRNLNTALDTLVGIGTIKDDEVEYDSDEDTGKSLIKIPKYQLAELWYSGTIG